MTGHLATVVLAVLASWALSQPPTPGGGKSQGRQLQASPASTQQEPASDPRGTDKTPIVVKVQPTPKTDAEIAREQQKEQREATAHWWNVAVGIGATIIMFLQFVMIGWQVRIASKQKEIIETQTGIMKLQERAANSSATAARTQAEHMLAGLAETRKATEAAIISANALKVIHRQWVKVESWTFETSDVPKVGLHAEVTVEISNRTPLTITIFAVRCYINGRKGGYLVADEYLVPDATTNQAVTILMNEQELADYGAGHLRLVIAGWVHYWDAFGDLQSEIIAACLEHIGPGVSQPSVRGVGGVMRKMRRMEKDWPIQEMIDWMDKHDREKDAKGEW